MRGEFELVDGLDLHGEVIEAGVLEARSRVWIATADLKDMHIRSGRGRGRPVLDAFDDLAARGVHFRLIHASLPSRPFRATLERYERLLNGAMELQICPRSHWKLVIVDDRFAYCGSANFTGAGLGLKHEDKRNLELGVITRDPGVVSYLADKFDSFWMGAHCEQCRIRELCPDPIV